MVLACPVVYGSGLWGYGLGLGVRVGLEVCFGAIMHLSLVNIFYSNTGLF